MLSYIHFYSPFFYRFLLSLLTHLVHFQGILFIFPSICFQYVLSDLFCLLFWGCIQSSSFICICFSFSSPQRLMFTNGTQNQEMGIKIHKPTGIDNKQSSFSLCRCGMLQVTEICRNTRISILSQDLPNTLLGTDCSYRKIVRKQYFPLWFLCAR